MTALHIVVQRTAITQRHADHVAFGLIGCLFDGFRNFTGLGMTMTNTPLTVTNNHQGCKTKTATTFHNFGHAVDTNQTLQKFRLITALLIPATSVSVSVL
jgi:hypothetical protein